MGASPMQLAAQRLFGFVTERLAAANAWARRPGHVKPGCRPYFCFAFFSSAAINFGPAGQCGSSGHAGHFGLRA
jgi:hypothetical protein